MAQSKILAFFILFAGMGLGAWIRGSISEPEPLPSIDNIYSASTDGPPIESKPKTVHSVVPPIEQAELNRLSAENQNLLQQISQLNQKIAELEESVEAPVPAVQSRKLTTRRGAAALTLETLVEAGIDQDVATNLKSRLDEISLQRLYLQDQARREGWLGKEQYRDQIRTLTQAQNNLQDEFGEQTYSRYLYAMGRPNQVTVQSVIDNSPAFHAGLRPGDQILSYGESSVFAPGDVRRGTQSGQANELVPIKVIRDNLELDVYIPRGPMGIQMSSDSIRPPDD